MRKKSPVIHLLIVFVQVLYQRFFIFINLNFTQNWENSNKLANKFQFNGKTKLFIAKCKLIQKYETTHVCPCVFNLIMFLKTKNL
jgi:hypothetical protein